MTGEYTLAVYMSLGLSAVLAVGFSMPKLTEAQTGPTSSAQHAELMRAEASFCRGNFDTVDCACFAEKSGHVIANDTPPIREVYSMPQQDLARVQAETSC